jgi:hypothetical protein
MRLKVEHLEKGANMVRTLKKQRGVFERPARSGIWWICYYDQFGKKHREKVGMKQSAIACQRRCKREPVFPVREETAPSARRW